MRSIFLAVSLAGFVSSVSAETVALKVGESRKVPGAEIRLLRVVEDSRCPRDVLCFWAGRIVAEVEIMTALKSGKFLVDSLHYDCTFHAPYYIKLSYLEAPSRDFQPMKDSDYRFWLYYGKDQEACIKDVPPHQTCPSPAQNASISRS